MDADERNIESKISKKQEELERTEKRLKSLENVRPQFMEEAEKLEKELQRYYDVYMEKHRNLDYLEHELDKYRRNEEERMEVVIALLDDCYFMYYAHTYIHISILYIHQLWSRPCLLDFLYSMGK